MTDLRKLDAAATQGVWGINDDLKGSFDDYEYLAVCGDAHAVMHHPKCHDDYAPSLDDMRLFAALVNAYRAGELVEVNKLHRYLGGAEDACDVRDDSGAVCGRLRCFHPKGASFDDLATALGNLAKIYRAMADGKLEPLTPEQMKEL